MNIKTLVKDNWVTFDSYRQGYFYYRIKHYRGEGFNQTEDEYIFPVPLDDIGTATLESYDKAITFMRWIRKAIEENTLTLVNE